MSYDCVLFTDVTYPNIVYKPLGAYLLANHLRANGYSCLVVDHFHTFTQKQTLEIISRAVGPETKFVGFSIAFFNNAEGTNPMNPWAVNQFSSLDYNQAFCPQGANFELAIVAAIKELNHNCKIVLGGAARISTLIRNTRVDYVISGFAEVAALDLLCSIGAGTVPSNAVKNIWGVYIIDGGSAEAFDYKHSSMVWLPQDISGAKVLQLDISRGCKFNCNFCDWSMRGTKTNKWVRHIDALATEIQRNYDLYGVYKYFVHDHTFNESDYKINVIKEAVKQLTFQPIFWCHARPDLLVKHPGRTDIMFESGVRSMMLGIDTLNPATAKLIGKGIDPNKIVAELKNIRHRYGNELLTHGNFVIGLPNESIDSILQTSAELNNGDIPLHHWSYNALMISTDTANWWGSAYEQNPGKYGYTTSSQEVDTEYNVECRKNSLMNWQNTHMTFGQAMQLNQQLTESARQNKNYLDDSMTNWALMGFTDLELTDLQQMTPSSIDWQSVSKQRLLYLHNYKKQLFSHIV